MKELLIAITGIVLGIILMISYSNADEKKDKTTQKLIWALLGLLTLIACFS